MIYQLKYTDKTKAIQHLKKLGVIDSKGNKNKGVKAVIHLPKFVDVKGTYNDQGEQITPPTFLEGYHIDIVSVIKFNFEPYEIFPKHPKHKVA